MEEEYVRLIFGLKLKQIRTDRNLSLFGLSKLCGLSKSYLNEIEKGKKYPKTDKIVILSEALDVPYDQLVSIKLDKNLAPIGEILQSKILKEIPLDLFGIQESDLIDIIAEAPAKVNAFISTIIEIAQNYNLSRESFFLASLRSYQEANNNFFGDIEKRVEDFAEAYHIDLSKPISSKELEEILIEEYGYVINNDELDKHKELNSLRSVFVPKTKTLLLDSSMDEPQRTFIYAKEIAYNFLAYDERLYTFSWIKFKSFDQVLNNFYASYFAGALIIPRKTLVPQLETFFKNKSFRPKAFIKMMSEYNASPESFYQRLTNILPKDFKLQDLFFLRFTHRAGDEKFHLKKELHITHQQSPQANETNEHYCRRWISIKTLEEITKTKDAHVFDIQISQYDDSNNEYLVLSSATADPFREHYYRSISIGFLISAHLKRKVLFTEDKTIKKRLVGVTCERCSVADCKERKAAPKHLIRKEAHQRTAAVVDDLMQRFS
ncbi:helix-turn-helix domain-containing protein [Sungkyunkwania multivorans]|uniref:Helix-turn-helix domain-containing protein n=1 Tax=Sungkyunkwania multivorans TaxID=1173618 RepID=A0ABW3CX21_9FLAO